jgi:hypothetical protein
VEEERSGIYNGASKQMLAKRLAKALTQDCEYLGVGETSLTAEQVEEKVLNITAALKSMPLQAREAGKQCSHKTVNSRV